MDKFVDKNGKIVLTIDDEGNEEKDEKYFEDIAKLTDKQLVEEYLKRELPEVLLDAEKLRKILKELKDDTTKS